MRWGGGGKGGGMFDILKAQRVRLYKEKEKSSSWIDGLTEAIISSRGERGGGIGRSVYISL